MIQRSDLGTQVAVAPAGLPRVRPDLDPVVNRADFSQQRAELALGTYATSPAGSARRELFERVKVGEDVDRVIDSLRNSRGLNVSGDDRAFLREYQAKSLVTAPRLAIDAPSYTQVANPILDRSAGVYATPDAYTISTQAKLSPTAHSAIAQHRSKLNSEIREAAGALNDLEAHPNPADPDYRRAHDHALREYERLTHGLRIEPATLQMAVARERAQEKVKAIQENPVLANTVSPRLQEHFQMVAKGGNPSASDSTEFAGIQTDFLQNTMHEKEFALSGQKSIVAMAPKDIGNWTEREYTAQREVETLTREVDRLKVELARRELTQNPATGMPRPTIAGRFAGMENDEDLNLSRERLLQTAIMAEGGGPTAEALIREMQRPPEPQPGLDHDVVAQMYQDRQVAIYNHKVDMRAPLHEVPPVGPSMAERTGMGAADLSNPPFKGDGPSNPPFLEGRGPDSEGPFGEGPDQDVLDLDGDPYKFRPTAISPETHAAEELLKEIQEVEKEAQARIRQEKIFAFLAVGGAALTATVAVASEVATAPMNPHADPSRALQHVATAVNTTTDAVGKTITQRVHHRTKADSDIKNVIETYTREKRAEAEGWAEKMSNQMGHLDNLIPPVADLDRLERSVADSLDAGSDFKGFYEDMRDMNAFDIHMAAANEMIMSSNPELQKTGQAIAQQLKGDGSLQNADWKTLQNFTANMNTTTLEKGGGKLAFSTYETYLRGMERQNHASILELKAREAIQSAVGRGELGRLIGDEGRAQMLLDAARPTDPTDHRSPEQVLLQSLDQKHQIESSIQDSWRTLVARSPIHAERIIHGGMDPNAQLAHLYKRRSPDEMTPDRAASEGLLRYFQGESQHRLGRGNKGELYEELGIPRGWGEHTVAGSSVGLAPSQNGGTQALLMGYKPNSNEVDRAAIHLFTREGITPPISELRNLGLSGADPVEFQKTRTLVPLPHAHMMVEGDDIRKLSHDKLTARIAQDYNAAVKAAYADHAERQLDADANSFAAMKILGRPLRPSDGVLDPVVAERHASNYRDSMRDAYARLGDTMAARESIQAGAARSMATQLKAAHTMGGFSQVMESNRGHFNYPQHRSLLDRDPRVSLEGKGGNGRGTDLQRMLTQADNSFRSMPGEIRKVRSQGFLFFNKVNTAQDPRLLYKLSDRTAQVASCMDTPVKQSQLTGQITDSDRYEAANRFLARHGYGI